MDDLSFPFAETLIAWYRHTARPLPWRGSWQPYHIWISEIMLQQTQMERGVGYFNRWIAELPDVAAVAAADEQQILRLWQGLGYYARARNLHRAAGEIMTRFGGTVPCEYDRLLTLPGIGPYTAAAIASIAGNQDVPVVDANVARVYARLFDVELAVKSPAGERRIRQLAEELLPPGKARYYNEAIMDFGGLLCTPRAPKCGDCPLADHCLALQRGVVEERPSAVPKRATVVEKSVVGLIRCGERYLIRRIAAGRQWAGLWDLPGGVLYSEKAAGFVPPQPPDEEVLRCLLCTAAGMELELAGQLVTVHHQYTHHRREVECYLCRAAKVTGKSEEKWVTLDEMQHYAFPAGARKILQYLLNRDLL